MRSIELFLVLKSTRVASVQLFGPTLRFQDLKSTSLSPEQFRLNLRFQYVELENLNPPESTRFGRIGRPLETETSPKQRYCVNYDSGRIHTICASSSAQPDPASFQAVLYRLPKEQNEPWILLGFNSNLESKN